MYYIILNVIYKVVLKYRAICIRNLPCDEKQLDNHLGNNAMAIRQALSVQHGRNLVDRNLKGVQGLRESGFESDLYFDLRSFDGSC